jgi:Cof subfamily protein (haloacid dehalogenase superfamily)
MPIKLLALDIDGTLLTTRGELTARNHAAISKARGAGVQVVLLTGRRFGSAYLLMQELKLQAPLISHNGALTKDLNTLETLYLYPLAIETAREMIAIARDSGVDFVCSFDEPQGVGKMVIEGISESNKSLQRYIEKYRDSVIEVADLHAHIQHPPIQVMFSGRCSRMDQFEAELQEVMGDRVRVFKTRYPSYDVTILDAVNKQASKGDSLARIAGEMGLDSGEVMAIGDNHNDLTMLRFAGLGVIMANAEDVLKEMGFPMTASNEEDGVAEAIERYILKA